MTFAEIDPRLDVVDRALGRRKGAGERVAQALDAVAASTLVRWSRGASAASVARARAALTEAGVDALHAAVDAAPSEGPAEASALKQPSAAALLARMTGAVGAEAYEVVERGFRRSLSRMGARFVARHAREAIDDEMGPMHATVVAAELLSSLERIDGAYLESLAFSLETLQAWGAVSEEPLEKNRLMRVRKSRPLSSPKRRA